MKGHAFIALILASTSAGALAQTANEATNEGIEEIVVTATRRSENLQRVPVAVTALTSRTLDTASVGTVTKLSQVTPGLVINRNTVLINPVLRGVGTSSGGPGNESSVAVYIDGIYQPDLTGSQLDLLKVERVEVLRGPQGTLFGRNATGGLINIITPTPSFEPTLDAMFRYGRFNERTARVYAATGLSDTVAIDVSGLYTADDGYVRDIIRGGKTGNRRVYAGRAKLLFKPSDTFEMTLAASAFDSKDLGQAVAQPLNGNTSGRLPPNTDIILPQKPREFAGDVAQAYGRGHDVALAFKKSLGTVRIEGNASYLYHLSHLTRDSDASPGPGFAATTHQHTWAYQEELRLLSDNDSPFQWIVGAYGFQSKGDITPLAAAATLILEPVLHTKSVAGFIDGTYKITDRLTIGGGLRYTWEKRDIRQNLNGAFAYANKKTFDNWSPRVLVQYFIDPKVNVYASYSQAFKSGVFNGQSTQTTAVNPEINKAIEIGFKGDLTQWLRLNLAAYHYRYTDLQVATRPAGSPATVLQNAGEARMKGIEAEITAAPVAGLQLRAAAAWQRARYKNLQNVLVQVPNIVDGVPSGNNAVLFNASGTSILRAPDFTLSLGADWSHETSIGTFGISSNFYHSSTVHHTYDSRINQPSYETLAGEIFFELPSKHVRFSIWADNLTNTTILDSVVTVVQGDIVQYNRPRRIGVGANVKF